MGKQSIARIMGGRILEGVKLKRQKAQSENEMYKIEIVGWAY